MNQKAESGNFKHKNKYRHSYIYTYMNNTEIQTEIYPFTHRMVRAKLQQASSKQFTHT